MPINRILKIMFIHNPKCGGSSMEKFFSMTNKYNRFDKKILSGLQIVSKKTLKTNYSEPWKNIILSRFNKPIQHLTPQELIDENYITEAEFRNNFSFVFIRNPWDKVISSYESYFKKLHPDFNKFLLWVEKIVEYEKDGLCFIFKDKNKESMNTHFKEQHKFVNYNGEQIVNFIGRHENINNDFKKVCELTKVQYMSLEKINATAKKKHYSTYYNDEQMAMVGEIYKTDIELFNYKFERLGD